MRTLFRPVEAGAPWWRRVDPLVAAEFGAVALVVLFHAMFKTWSMWIRSGDEHIYFAMARAMADGSVPYRDFFFAHPPVHLLVPAVLFKLFGFSYGLALWIAPLASLLAGVAVWRLVRRFAPPWAAILAMVLFLFGRTALQASSHITGVNIAVMFLAWGAERLAADRPKTGGVLLGLAVMTGIYVLPAVVGIFACLAFVRPRRFVGGMVAFVLTALGIAAVFDLASGGGFFEQAIWYQQGKTASGGFAGATFAKTKGAELFFNWKLFLGSIVAGIGGLVAIAAVADRLRPAAAVDRKPTKGTRKARRSKVPAAAGIGAWGTLGEALRDAAPTVADLPGPDGVLPPPGAGILGWLEGQRRRLAAAATAAPWAALGLVGALWTALHWWVFLPTLPLVWRYYYVVVFLGASVATAMAVVAVWRSALAVWKAYRARQPASAWRGSAAYGIVLLAIAVGYWRHDLDVARQFGIGDELAEEDEEQPACNPAGCDLHCRNKGNVSGECLDRRGCVCRYGWVASPAHWVPGWFADLLHKVWWGGEVMPAGVSPPSSIENTLWHESRGAPVEERTVEAVDAIVSRACPGDALFGDSETAPMMANLTGLRVAAEIFDTNQQRWSTGFIDPAEAIAAVEADGVRFLVLRWSARDAAGNDRFANGWANAEPVQSWIREGFARVWPGADERPFDFVVYDRKGAPLCGGAPVSWVR